MRALAPLSTCILAHNIRLKSIRFRNNRGLHSLRMEAFLSLGRRLNENIMATVKVKLRPSSVEGKAGVIYYQITHNRKTKHITTRLRLSLSDWDVVEEMLVPTAHNHSMIQNRIDSDVALLRRSIIDLESSGIDYSAEDIISRYKSPQSHILVLDYMRSQVEQLRTTNRLGTDHTYLSNNVGEHRR